MKVLNILKIILSIALLLGNNRFLAAQQAMQERPPIILNAIILNGDTLPYVIQEPVNIYSTYIDDKRRRELNRLRYNVHKVYPYAVTAAYVLNKLEQETSVIDRRRNRKKYQRALEKEMKAKFKDELKNLSTTQGKILVKLINRQTGRDCYSLLKDLKGGFNVTIYQATAKLFDNNLKNNYDPYGEDKDIEMMVKEIEDFHYQRHQIQKKIEEIKARKGD